MTSPKSANEFKGGYYVTPEGAISLSNYEYSGADLSYFYRFILTPMNKKLVKLIPLYIAPNLITLAGLLITCSTFILTSIYSTHFDSVIPSWLCLTCAIGLFVYQTLDNLDGRQARRTQSSSPLGLLVDHGVDSLNVTISTLTFGSILQFSVYNSPLNLYYLWLSCSIPFIFATIEEYCTSHLILPIINGPTDGVIIVCIFMLISSFSPGIFAKYIKDSILKQNSIQYNILSSLLPDSMFNWILMQQLNFIVLFIGFITVSITLIINIRAIRRHSRSIELLRLLSPFIILIVCNIIFIKYSYTYSSSSILISLFNLSTLTSYHHLYSIYTNYSHLFYMSQCFLFCNLICKLMLSHLCSYKYKSKRLVLIPQILISINSIINYYYKSSSSNSNLSSSQNSYKNGLFISDEISLFILFIFNLSVYLHFVILVIKEMKSALSIRFITIPRRKQSVSGESLIRKERSKQTRKQIAEANQAKIQNDSIDENDEINQTNSKTNGQ